VYPKVVLIPIPGNLNTDPAWRFLIQDDSWEDPDLLREIGGKEVALSLEEGPAESVEVPMTRRSEIGALLAKLGIE